MSKFNYDTKQIQIAVQQARPIKYTDSGLMGKIWIANETIHSYYKNVLLRAPCKGFPDLQVDAESFRKAVNAARTEQITFNITAAGNLTVTAGVLKTRMQALNEPIPPLATVNNWYSAHGELLPVLTALAKWVPNEAPQVWATSLLLRDGYAYATNGKYMIREKLNVDFEFECAIAKPMLEALVKLKMEPTSVGYARGQMFFGFADGVQMDAPVLAAKWPDVSKFFNMEMDMQAITPEFLEVMDQLTGYDEGQAILEITGESTAKADLPDKIIPKMSVDIKFQSTKFSKPFNCVISQMSKLAKGMERIGLGSQALKMENSTRTVVIAYVRGD
ncbi:hypothetical protein XK44_003685 [Salmonella enterica subsp. enterica]|uniref:DNA polymerase beta subunit n=3 Tax=Rosemountvirus yarpen TaxID=2846142 RepID=A0A6G8RAF0_9CAUD|nr:hypothetical protein [Escherichia coli]YP_009857631.1 DNA polymerase beta subunit [Salmonella phage yarpen]EBY3944465.1 hypothetical protein [Salmonella enterica subsp. enterica serovar Kottbus]EBY8042353.1 hypothetical protein [Salmonella enterica subsp. enterica serovar Agona]EEJ2154928.1 hypothetical protein [Salmonella enterica subsp. enterica]QIN98473.1 DNA polymerase beta subunit [Salmonella phage nenneke]QIN98776.1 DNA polymerase beta subunit [Salmonella phage ciri]QIN98847.1 DNA p